MIFGTTCLNMGSNPDVDSTLTLQLGVERLNWKVYALDLKAISVSSRTHCGPLSDWPDLYVSCIKLAFLGAY